jgi:hypothetical protein
MSNRNRSATGSRGRRVTEKRLFGAAVWRWVRCGGCVAGCAGEAARSAWINTGAILGCARRWGSSGAVERRRRAHAGTLTMDLLIGGYSPNQVRTVSQGLEESREPEDQWSAATCRRGGSRRSAVRVATSWIEGPGGRAGPAEAGMHAPRPRGACGVCREDAGGKMWGGSSGRRVVSRLERMHAPVGACRAAGLTGAGDARFACWGRGANARFACGRIGGGVRLVQGGARGCLRTGTWRCCARGAVRASCARPVSCASVGATLGSVRWTLRARRCEARSRGARRTADMSMMGAGWASVEVRDGQRTCRTCP